MEQDVEMKKEKKKDKYQRKDHLDKEEEMLNWHPQDRYITMYLSKLYLRHYLHGDPQAYRESLQTSTET